jgi:hypothetical protein
VARKQTFTLDFTPDLDFTVIALFSSLRDHKLCFQTNAVLGSSMVRQPDLELKLDKKGATGLFARFFFLSEDEEEFYLVANRGTNGHFIPEMKLADYFLVIKNRGRYTSESEVLRQMQSIRNVSSALLLKPEELTSTENFLLLEPVVEKEKTKQSIPPVL